MTKENETKEPEYLHDGSLYRPMDPDLLEMQLRYLDDVQAYNNLKPSDLEGRRRKLKEMFAEIGEDCYVEIPFRSNFGGRHVHFGRGVYANYNLMLVDDTHIYVGDYTMIGPNCMIVTAAHPIAPELRWNLGYQHNAPVKIGRNCWIGGGVIILPGVTIGDDVIIGAGSIVTKDLPSSVVAWGQPCRVQREITEQDRIFATKGRKTEADLLRVIQDVREQRSQSEQDESDSSQDIF